MYNEDLVQVIIDKYGREQALIYCQIESEKYEMRHAELKHSKDVARIDVYECAYEKEWWLSRIEKLKNETAC